MSKFAALKSVHIAPEAPAEPPVSQPSMAAQPPAKAGKRGRSDYRQFSAYLRADLYRRLKVRVAEQDIDLSDAINDAVEQWLGQGSDNRSV